MRLRVEFLVVLAALGLAGCSTSQHEWMKVDQRYTREEFQRDYKECSRGGDLDETCMKNRGWVSVNPSKSEAAPPPPATPRSRGRY
jgi:hypothetical protein